MPVFTMTDARPHEMHGARFESVVAPSAGSTELCAPGAPPSPRNRLATTPSTTREVFLVPPEPPPSPRRNADARGVGIGDLAPAGSSVKLDNDSETEAQLWVTTVVGLTATTPDRRDWIVPPWTL